MPDPALVNCGWDPRSLDQSVGRVSRFWSDNGCGALTTLGNLQCCGFTWCGPYCLNTHRFSSEHSRTTDGSNNDRYHFNSGQRVEERRI